ncbi:hypothetical protein Taro_051618 [Colocasia esculenta]|uniref:Transcription factor CBF/NF-Y/archaeal histone domain-containing protein n=1 Tax=Colocasia esculenta TaxID=4460 RepID=A0A843XGF8_COLES|nr:hypothetical protein [Colocasia esculenta]
MAISFQTLAATGLSRKAVEVDESSDDDVAGSDHVHDDIGQSSTLQGGPAAAAAAAATREGGSGSSMREQDRLMPVANIIRIMRKVLPTHAKLSDEAKGTIQLCVSQFIDHVTALANDRCRQEQRKTVTAEDMLWAIGKLGLDEYVEYLSLYLHRYRLQEGTYRPARRDLLSQAAQPVVTTPAVGLQAAPGLVMAAQGYHAGSFFPTEGGSGSAVAVATAAASAGGVMTPGDYQRINGAGTQAGPSQQAQGPPHMFGFDPFNRYN